MMHKGKVIGVLDLESPQLNYFTEDHVQTLSILAANLAVSLENARLYEQVARDEARLERDLQAAKRIQGALLRPVPTEDFGLDIAAQISFGSRSVRRFIRISPLWTSTAGDRARRRQRQGNGGGTLRRGGYRHHAKPCSAETSARGNAQADEPDRRRAAHRRAVHDRVLRDVAEGPEQVARRKRGAVAAAAV